MAGKRSSLAFCTSFSSWAAPSRRLYSECTCRWTKSAWCFMDLAWMRLAALGNRRRRSPGSLPLDGARRFRGDVEDHAVDSVDLVDDPRRDLPEEIVRQPRPVRGHRVLAHHRAERDHLRVRAEIPHDSHRPDGQQHGERLPQLALEAGGADLVLDDRVGIAQEGESLLSDVAEN